MELFVSGNLRDMSIIALHRDSSSKIQVSLMNLCPFKIRAQ